MSTTCRSGCLVLAVMVATHQFAYAEEAAGAGEVKPAEVPAVAPPATIPQTPAADAAAKPQPTETAPAADAAANPQPAETDPVPTAAAAQTTPAAEDTVTSHVLAAWNGLLTAVPVHGFLRSRYQARWTDGASDQDLYETLGLDIGNPESDRVTAHFLGDLATDLDGRTANRGFYAFDSVRDSTGENPVPLVYSAYLDVHRVEPLSILRLGRQSIYETPVISFFDGLRAETQELGSNRVKLGAYGGIPVHLYQDYVSSDLLGGAYAEGHLWRGSRARVDLQHLEGRNGTQDHQNNLIGLGAWQSVGRYVDLHAHYTRLDDADHDVLLRGSFTQPEWDTRVQASYYQLLQPQRDAVVGVDAFYPILKDYVPYREYRWMVSQGLGDHLNLDAGMDMRRLTDAGQASEFNHEYDRYFGTVDVLDVLVKGSSLSLTEELWDGPARHTESQGVDISCPVAATSRMSLGTAHYLYKYDYYSDQERVDVQTYYLKFEHTHSRALRFSVEYEFEDDGSSGDYNEVRCEATCSF